MVGIASFGCFRLVVIGIVFSLGIMLLVPAVQAQFTYDTVPPSSLLLPYPSNPTGNPNPEYRGWSNDTLTRVMQVLWNVAIPPGASGNLTGKFTPDLNVFFNFTPGPLAAGTYTITANAMDEATNWEKAPFTSDTITINPALPWSTIESPFELRSPYNSTKWANEGAVWGKYGDDVGVTQVQIFIQRLNDSWFWDGSKFIANAGAPFWLTATMSGTPPSASGTWTYTFTPPQDQYYFFQSQATDGTNTEMLGYGEAILYDNNQGGAWFGLGSTHQNLPTWTNTSQINVTWNGTDPFGYKYMDLAWKNQTKDTWIYWLRATGPGWSWFGATYPVIVKDGEKYTFRINMTDSTDNTGPPTNQTSTTIDSTPPSCSLDSLEPYSKTFDLVWTSVDTISGVAKTDAYYTTDNITWKWMAEPSAPACGSSDPAGYYDCSAADGTYFFSCNATDIAGAVGALATNIVGTIVDGTAPVTEIKQLPEWSNTKTLNLSFSAFEESSGVACYEAQYSENGGAWTDIKSPDPCTYPPDFYEIFGPTSPVSVDDGDDFGFRIRARDNAGNQESWPADGHATRTTSTIIDTEIPELVLEARDQDSQLLDRAVSSGDITKVTIKSDARDQISGIKSNLIEYWLTENNIRTYNRVECGTAIPGAWSTCSVDVDIASGTQLKYRSVALDYADNSETSGFYYVVTHPLANFVTHNVFVTLGSAFLADVQVRNLHDEQTEVTLDIGGYEPAGFIDSGTEDYIISNGGRTLTVQELNPYEERVYQVQILSAEPDEVGTVLTLDAENDLTSPKYVTDSDTLAITTGFPAAFSGMNEAAVFLLIISATMVFFFVGRRIEF